MQNRVKIRVKVKKSAPFFKTWTFLFGFFLRSISVSLVQLKMSQEDSPRASGFSSPANEPDNSFADILKAQETLFAQTDGILTTIISRPPGEDGQVSFEPKKLETLKEIFTNLKVRDAS